MWRPDQGTAPPRAGRVKEATDQLGARLIDTGAVTEPHRLRAVIQNSWPEDLVSVGDYAFLPHFRTEAVRHLLTAVGVAPAPIHWEKDPNRSARVVIFIVAPPRETPRNLQVVGAFARALSDPDTLEALHGARTADQVVGLAAFAAIDLPSHLVVRDVM